MDTDTYLKSRTFMQKRAWDPFGSLAHVGKDVGKFFAENTASALMLAVPTTSLMAAWLAYKALSPKAVADNASDYALNATQKESVIQTLRDLEESKVTSKLKRGRKRPHDQFL